MEINTRCDKMAQQLRAWHNTRIARSIRRRTCSRTVARKKKLVLGAPKKTIIIRSIFCSGAEEGGGGGGALTNCHYLPGGIIAPPTPPSLFKSQNKNPSQLPSQVQVESSWPHAVGSNAIRGPAHVSDAAADW